ncbi:hypothetical protein CA85_48460 [Allorhodopirellula solitaria]|uniref:Uncharacterized protein n=1 Tax=Allorhodopirellula solitaria TaxID=2527987 RepID=A0A5C5X0C7_9BACT|nr:hypothetical protein CA85_48460 [Allorhodopirellula solitaria]
MQFLSDCDSTIYFTRPAKLGGSDDEPLASLPRKAVHGREGRSVLATGGAVGRLSHQTTRLAGA